MDTQIHQSKSKINKLLLRSTFLWCLVILISIDIGLWLSSRTGRPVLDDGPRLVAMKQFLANDSKPDIVLLGSSLSFAASYFCDTAYVLKVSNENLPDSNSYFTSLYFQQLLGHHLRKEPTVTNFALPGGMAADAYVVASKLLQHGKHPKVIIYEIAARDMIDNLLPLGAGCLGGALNTSNFIAVDELSWGAKWLRDLNRLGEHPSLESLGNFYVSSIWNYYKTKSIVRDWLVVFGCQLFNREPSLYAAVHASSHAELLCGNPTFDDDIKHYVSRYNPPNFKQFALQKEELRKLAELCKQANIKLVLVNMPISTYNKALINTELYQSYMKELIDLSESGGCRLIQLDICDFHKQDYKDSAHLNARGGKKFQEKLVEQLAQTGTLKPIN